MYRRQQLQANVADTANIYAYKQARRQFLMDFCNIM